MGSLIAGWILFAIGVVMYLIAIWVRIRKLVRPDSGAGEEGLETFKDTAEAIAKLAEAFGKFSEDVQFILLGSGALLAGLYLLTNKPF